MGLIFKTEIKVWFQCFWRIRPLNQIAFMCGTEAKKFGFSVFEEWGIRTKVHFCVELKPRILRYMCSQRLYCSNSSSYYSLGFPSLWIWSLSERIVIAETWWSNSWFQLLRGMPPLAHCTADRFASFATLIIYAPSRCMNQQMQVGILNYLQAVSRYWKLVELPPNY
jgi:hypothetical protein